MDRFLRVVLAPAMLATGAATTFYAFTGLSHHALLIGAFAGAGYLLYISGVP